jgi:hypothetical protein
MNETVTTHSDHDMFVVFVDLDRLVSARDVLDEFHRDFMGSRSIFISVYDPDG